MKSTGPKACLVHLIWRVLDVFSSHTATLLPTCTYLGKFKSTTCPENRHYAHWAAGTCGQQPASTDTDDDQGGHATALVVGGNSGSDCVGFQRLLSGNGNFSLENWRAVVRTHTGGRKYPMPVCGPRGLQEYPLAASPRPTRTVLSHRSYMILRLHALTSLSLCFERVRINQ